MQVPVQEQGSRRTPRQKKNMRAPVRNVGKTSTAADRSSAPKNSTHTLLSEKPIARFSTHGTVAQVLQDLDAHVPEVFGEKGEKIIPNLHQIIRHYMVNAKWNYVVVSLTQGFARQELEALLSRNLGHEGPLIIDPDVSTRDHQVFSTEKEALPLKEQMIRTAEERNSIVLVLYGINNPDGNKKREIAVRELQQMNVVLGFLLAEDARFRSIWGLNPLDAHIVRQMKLLGLNIKEAEHRVTGLTSNDMPHINALHALAMDAHGEDVAESAAIAMTAARLSALGLKPAEERRQEEAARAEEDRQKQADKTHAREARERQHEVYPEAPELPETGPEGEEATLPPPPRTQRAAEAGTRPPREAEEATRENFLAAEETREGDADYAESRRTLLYREARRDRMESEYEAQDRAYESLEESARTPGERHLFAQERGEAEREAVEQGDIEKNIATRERKSEAFEAQERAEIISNEAREEEPASTRQEGTAEGRYATLAESGQENEESGLVQEERLDAALQDRRETERDANDRREELADEAADRSQESAAEAEHERQKNAAETIAENNQQMRETEDQRREDTVERADHYVSAASEAEHQRREHTTEAMGDNKQDVRESEGQRMEAERKTEEARLEGEYPKDAGSARARADELQREKADESRFPETRAARQAAEEAEHPTYVREEQQGQQRVAENESEKRQEIREDVRDQQQETAREADRRDDARSDYSEQTEQREKEAARNADDQRNTEESQQREAQGRNEEQQKRDEDQREEARKDSDEQFKKAEEQRKEASKEEDHEARDREDDRHQRPEDRVAENHPDEQPPLTPEDQRTTEAQMAENIEHTTQSEDIAAPDEVTEAPVRAVDEERNDEIFRRQDFQRVGQDKVAQAEDEPETPEEPLPKPSPEG